MRHLVLLPKISLKHDWMKELGSELVRQPEGEVAEQTKCSPSSQPNPDPDQDRTEKPSFAVMQIKSAKCLTRLTSTSEYLDCHILL